jgi:hypothetical protein
MKPILTKEEIQKFGFTYEPDATKCKTRKLKTYFPAPELQNEDWKAAIAEDIPYQYVHEVKETPNPYEGDPNFLANPKVLVVGHTPNGKII